MNLQNPQLHRSTIKSLREDVGTVRRLLLGLHRIDLDFEKTVRQLCRLDAKAWRVAMCVKPWKIGAEDAGPAVTTLQSVKRAAEEMYQRRGKVQKWMAEKGFGFVDIEILDLDNPENRNSVFLPRQALCVELLRLAGADEPIECVDLYSDRESAAIYTWPTVFVEWEKHEKGRRAVRLTCGKCYGSVIVAGAAVGEDEGVA